MTTLTEVASSLLGQHHDRLFPHFSYKKLRLHRKGAASLENKNIFVIYPAVRISLGTTRHSGATLSFPNLTNRIRIGPPPFKIHGLYSIWQYRLWSFKSRDTKCIRFVFKGNFGIFWNWMIAWFQKMKNFDYQNHILKYFSKKRALIKKI